MSIKESLVIMTPVKPNGNPRLRAVGMQLGASLGYPVYYYTEDEPAQPTDHTPWSKVARVRNKMLDQFTWRNFDWVMWLDSDVIWLTPDAPERLVKSAGNGIAAPMVFAGDSDIFYDWAAFIQRGTSVIEPLNRWHVAGRNLNRAAPYFNEPTTDPTVPMDCVGCCYVVHTDILKTGVRFEDHPAFTDHFPICRKALEMRRPVVVDRMVTAKHAWLPDFGEAWH